ncbi:dynein light intermediate chain-domain-containing protein [Rhodocollybia butyracea]|uniref:Dynein light intermediate chain-domain-containing protein n=1 Tax=Rhodocollybia butyracea TaxID=206335 RepID=A0A9P5Q932_9AGAR|nr:dynein light intermediate chain-domain-containing protein [Rhodocollybia butyracea]
MDRVGDGDLVVLVETLVCYLINDVGAQTSTGVYKQPSPVPTEGLWSSILDSVSSSRSLPSKNVLLLGNPGSGKSVIGEALLGKRDEGKADFAVGYEWADVRDEGDEDTLARLSLYTVPSSNPSLTSLIPYFLPPKIALGHTTVIIVLDWTQPWTFVDQLEEWLVWIENWASGKLAGKEARELEVIREENRERWQSHLQHYTEPSLDSTESLPTSSSASALSSNTVLPLGPGTLTHNAAGVPIIVVCTKADLIDDGTDNTAAAHAGIGGGMVKGKGGEWEERTDGVMQILRTFCLKYGAALFYTAPMPETLAVLRQYTLHTLFVPPASPSSGEQNNAETTGSGTGPTKNPFPFPHRPNTLDRDRVVIPAGWDSWGKITILREFEPARWGEAWEKDLEIIAEGKEKDGGDGASRMYKELVPDQGSKPPPLPPFNSPTPEQAFLAKHYDESNLNKKAERDPRAAFKTPTTGEDGLQAAGAGIVGPMGTNSFSLPTVEKLFMEMESSANIPISDRFAGLDRPERLDRSERRTRPTNNHTSHGHPHRPSTLSPSALGGSPPSLNSSLRGPNSPSPVSPTGSTGSAGPGSSSSQHDVLQNFFNSLLTSRDRPTGGVLGGREGGRERVRSNGSSSSGVVGGTSAARREESPGEDDGGSS